MKRLIGTLIFCLWFGIAGATPWGTGGGTGTPEGTDVTLSAQAEAGGLTLTGQELDMPPATTTQSGYMTYTQVNALDGATALGKYESGTQNDYAVTIIDPASVFAVSPNIMIDPNVSAAFTVTKFEVNVSEDSTGAEVTMTLNIGTVGAGVGAYTPVVAATTTAGYTTTSTITNPNVPAGVSLFLAPSAAYSYSSISSKVTGDFD